MAAIDFTHGGNTSTTVQSGHTYAQRVIPAADVKVTALRLRVAGSVSNISPRIHRVSDGAALFSGSASAVVAGWNQLAITPVTLVAGVEYSVGFYVGAGGMQPYYSSQNGWHNHSSSGATLSVFAGHYTFPGSNGLPTTGGGTTEFEFGVVFTPNQPPNAPILSAPADGATIDRNSTNRFAWTFSDPDAGDSQSKFNLYYRLVGAGTWTTITQTIPNPFWDAAAATFTAGDYEWQVETYDAQGVLGARSASSFFTAANPPPTPTITDPINGQTIAAETHTATFSAPNVTASQWRTVADMAGAPNTGTVHQDSGVIESSTSRSHTLAFPVNNRPEHVQVRYRLSGLWSSWYSVAVSVSYTPPPVPTVQLTPTGTGIVVQVTNPTPGAGEQPITHNEIWVDDGDGETRRVATLPANGTWTYRTPRSGRDYDGAVRVIAVGDNGTRSSS